ncbi:MAG: hypothetical protein IJY46_07620 [Lentisphaeria bacterium]|nr:hypothetical protein [Lentisphaeria bacterium]
MHPLTIIIISAAAGFVLMDIVLNVRILFSCRRQIKWLKESNELLTQKNLELGSSCTDRAREVKHLRNELAEEKKKLDDCLNTGIATNDKLMRTIRERIEATAAFAETEKALKKALAEKNKAENELYEIQNKLKSAHNHISVLRAEIIKLNRQLNQTKRRG